MKFLECKIPPAVVFAIFVTLMWCAFEFLHELSFSVAARDWFLWSLFSGGVLIGLAGVAAFWKSKTTTSPHHPENASSIVRSGIYQFSRNPMYLGLLVALTGIAIYLANIFNILLLIGFVLYMNRFQIIPEERALEENFGEEFLKYKKSVRRWF